MEGPQIAFIVMLVASFGYFGSRLWYNLKGPSYAERIIKNAIPNKALLNHSAEFNKPDFIKVTSRNTNNK